VSVRYFWVEPVPGDPQRFHRTDTGEIFDRLGNCPPGAMWNAHWMLEGITKPGGFVLGGMPPDGRWLVVRLPNGHDWMIDSRCSNCTLPDDNAHRCWVRHGEPPNLTVDKNGVMCSAGAGSIQGGDWHGFLRNGELVQ
jgi:hypothetical protein